MPRRVGVRSHRFIAVVLPLAILLMLLPVLLLVVLPVDLLVVLLQLLLDAKIAGRRLLSGGEISG